MNKIEGIKSSGSVGHGIGFEPANVPILRSQLPYVAVCVPCFEYIRSEFLFSFAAMLYSSRIRPAIIRGSSSIVTVARDMCIENMMTIEEVHGTKFDWVFFMDADIVCNPSALNTLMSRDKDIIGGTYVRRTPPFDLMSKTLDGRPVDVDSGIIEVAAVPTGCLLIRRSVFDKFKRPYFRLRHDEESGKTFGEDVIFCEMARELGYSIWIDVDVTKELGHIAEQPLRPEVSNAGQVTISTIGKAA